MSKILVFDTGWRCKRGMGKLDCDGACMPFFSDTVHQMSCVCTGSFCIIQVLCQSRSGGIKSSIRPSRLGFKRLVLTNWLAIKGSSLVSSKFGELHAKNAEQQQTNKQTNKQTNNQTNKQTNKQTTNQTNKQTNNQTNKQTSKQTNQQTNNTISSNKSTTNTTSNNSNNKQQRSPFYLLEIVGTQLPPVRRVYCHCPWPGLLASIFVSSYLPGNDHISHLATRKIIDLKVPAGGRGYVIVPWCIYI